MLVIGVQVLLHCAERVSCALMMMGLSSLLEDVLVIGVQVPRREERVSCVEGYPVH